MEEEDDDIYGASAATHEQAAHPQSKGNVLPEVKQEAELSEDGEEDGEESEDESDSVSLVGVC